MAAHAAALPKKNLTKYQNKSKETDKNKTNQNKQNKETIVNERNIQKQRSDCHKSHCTMSSQKITPHMTLVILVMNLMRASYRKQTIICY